MVSAINSANNGAQDITALLQKLFKKLDKNGDNSVTKDELKTALSEANSGSTVSDSTLNDLFNKLDTDGDGSITESELVSGAQQMRPLPPPPDRAGRNGALGGPSASDMAQSLFKTADSDGDGQISRDQLYSALAQNGPVPENMDQIWSETDVNGDGYVTLAELQSAMEKHQQQGPGDSARIDASCPPMMYDQGGNAVEQAFGSLLSLLA